MVKVVDLGNNNRETIFLVTMNKNENQYDVYCNVNFSTDEGISITTELIKILTLTRNNLNDMLVFEMEKRGVVPKIFDEINHNRIEEIKNTIDKLSPDEAKEFIKDVHGILVKGK